MNENERYAMDCLVDRVLARLGISRASVLPDLIAGIEAQIAAGGVQRAYLYYAHSPKAVKS